MSLPNKKKYFTKKLLEWFATNHRPMPWKAIKNPYFIWLSEIILQQTRVEQGLPYYEHFIEKYPTVLDLANATEDEVMRSWQGLGYYSRARNLHAAAKYIAFEKEGKFPDSYDEILSLKGVGPYTAAAIASFAYDLPHAVVDGNVYRVFSRYFGISTPIDSTAGKKEFTEIATAVLNRRRPADYNQALMDFGATHCTPKKPKCGSCPVGSKCTAKEENGVNDYPVKAKKLIKRDRYFNYLVLKKEDGLIIKKRVEKDIWTNLYDFPLIESAQLLERDEVEKLGGEAGVLTSDAEFISVSKPFQQVLSHQRIHARFWEYTLKEEDFDEKEPYQFVNKNKLDKFAFPKIIDWYLKDNSLYLILV